MTIKIPFLIIEPYIFLMTASFTLSGIILPQLLLDNTCRRNFETSICSNINAPLFKKQQDIIQKETAIWLTVLLSCQEALSSVAILVLGPLADTIGMRNAMFLTLICMGMYCIVCIILTSLGFVFHPSLLFLAVPFLSICGSNSGCTFLATSYVALLTSTKNRSFRVAFISAAISFAMCLVAFASGFLINWIGYRGVYVTCLIFCILNALYLIFFVSDHRAVSNSDMVTQASRLHNQQTWNDNDNEEKDREQNSSAGTKDGINELIESRNSVNNDKSCGTINDQIMPADVQAKRPLSTRTQIRSILTKSNPITNLKELFNLLREKKQRDTVFSLIVITFAAILSWVGESYIIVLFIKSHPLNFSSIDVGYFLAFQSLSWGLIGYLIINVALRHFSTCSDFFIITLSLSAHSIYLILIGFSTSRVMIYVIQLLSAFATLDLCNVRSSLTKIADPDKYATITALSAAFQSIGALVASLTSTVIYAEFISIHRGAAFFFLAFISIISVIFAGRLLWKEKLEKQDCQSDSMKERRETVPLTTD